jgi:hypothetical protein
LTAPQYAPGVRVTAASIAVLCALALAACTDTVQSKPIPHNVLEGLIAAPYPVYWLGASFEGKALTEATHDPSGAYTVQYGNCLQGGQGTCVPPLTVVTSPDNSFIPAGDTPTRPLAVRGAVALQARGGRTILIPTAAVVVEISARDARLARAAADTIVPINEPGAPGAALPAARPDSGFGATPVPSQTPSPLRPLD